MDTTIARIDSWWIAIAFAVSMCAAFYGGWRWARKNYEQRIDAPGDKLTDASVALLGLLLAFTFSMALGRYEQRRQALVSESTAIGDFYTCASLLKEPHRTSLQKLIRDYAQEQLDTRPQMLHSADDLPVHRRSQREVEEITALVEQAITQGTPIANPLVFTLNSMTTATAARITVFEERLPGTIVILLFVNAVMPTFLIGQRHGAAREAHLTGAICFIVLVTLVVFVILDLNQPHRGLIQMPQGTLLRQIETMGGG